ncbi:MAG TPA: tetratricopeptide repeat protein [Nitrosopumilaceae archaeon]|jgi:tetratricopeptide (TPR) repeat protein|nr:tetratricopeptide repeat protein [Nitrosopumilaceae archaeon]
MKKLLLIVILFFFSANFFSQPSVHDLIVSAQLKDSLKDFDGALKDLNQVLSVSHENDTALWLHGKVYLEKDDFKSAMHDIDEVMRHHKYAEAFFIRGLIKAKTENYSGASADFSKAIALKTTFTKAYYNRGLAKAYLDDYRHAIDDFSKAIELDPGYSNAWFNRGYWRDLNGDKQLALTDLKKAMELDPKNGDIHFELALLMYQLNQKTESCKELEAAQNLGNEKAGELINDYCK